MLKASLIIANKDIKLLFSRGVGVIQTLLMGLLLIFVFSLSKNMNEDISAQATATIFWLASTFCQILTFNMLYAIEETTKTWTGLLLTPIPIQAVWLGKALIGLLILLTAQLIFLPATMVFLSQTPGVLWKHALLAIILVDIGLVALGSLLGTLSQGQTARESLLSIILFPLVLPLLLAGIRACANGLLAEPSEEITSWMNIVIAFDATFAAAGVLLFPFILVEDN